MDEGELINELGDREGPCSAALRHLLDISRSTDIKTEAIGPVSSGRIYRRECIREKAVLVVTVNHRPL
jgi:hypothetical protein